MVFLKVCSNLLQRLPEHLFQIQIWLSEQVVKHVRWSLQILERSYLFDHLITSNSSPMSFFSSYLSHRIWQIASKYGISLPIFGIY